MSSRKNGKSRLRPLAKTTMRTRTADASLAAAQKWEEEHSTHKFWINARIKSNERNPLTEDENEILNALSGPPGEYLEYSESEGEFKLFSVLQGKYIYPNNTGYPDPTKYVFKEPEQWTDDDILLDFRDIRENLENEIKVKDISLLENFETEEQVRTTIMEQFDIIRENYYNVKKIMDNKKTLQQGGVGGVFGNGAFKTLNRLTNSTGFNDLPFDKLPWRDNRSGERVKKKKVIPPKPPFIQELGVRAYVYEKTQIAKELDDHKKTTGAINMIQDWGEDVYDTLNEMMEQVKSAFVIILNLLLSGVVELGSVLSGGGDEDFVSGMLSVLMFFISFFMGTITFLTFRFGGFWAGFGLLFTLCAAFGPTIPIMAGLGALLVTAANSQGNSSGGNKRTKYKKKKRRKRYKSKKKRRKRNIHRRK